MNKVITINLAGNAYQLEEGGYDVLHEYLETAAAGLGGNPDRDEILSDIEGAIAEKFRALLGSQKNVVITREVVTVLAEMGPIETDPGSPDAKAAGGGSGSGGGAGTAGKAPATDPGPAPKRFYRIGDGAMIAGVCNGIAAYFNLDPTLVRLAFVFLTVFWGTGVLVYIIMAIVVPEARTPEEKAAASGAPMTAQEFIRRAREGYYGAVKDFPSRQARREWARRFRRDMRHWSHNWRYHWNWGWHGGSSANPPVFHPALGFTLPLFSLLIGTGTIVWACAAISLLATGAVFGMALPAGVPVWLAFGVMLFLYGTLVGSLKVGRRLCQWGMGRPNPAWSLIYLLDGIIGIAIAVILLALAIHHFPELRDAVQSIPSNAHQAANDLRTWWDGK
jgi:phage shock protein PspC (stress-responsive transcriptional regulator)